MKIVHKITELTVEGVITDLSIPKQHKLAEGIFVPDNEPFSVTLVLWEPCTKELCEALQMMFEKEKIQITFKNE